MAWSRKNYKIQVQGYLAERVTADYLSFSDGAIKFYIRTEDGNQELIYVAPVCRTIVSDITPVDEPVKTEQNGGEKVKTPVLDYTHM